MAHIFEYAVLRVTPDPVRGESVNIGLVVFLDSGIDVRMLPHLGKVTALDANLDLNALLVLPDQLRTLYSGPARPVGVAEPLRHLGVVSISEKATFSLQDQSQYDAQVESLMKRLVFPTPNKKRILPKNTRIQTSLRKAFAKQGILGEKQEDISKYKVVENFPIAEDENLYAEFALKNSQYHFTETTDFRSNTSTDKDKSRIASLAAIKFVEASKKFKQLRRYTVYAARSDNEVKSQLAMLGNNSDGVINVRSRSDMAAYMDQIMAAASHTHSIN